MENPDASDILYMQVAESFAMPIRRGTLLRGERMPSVRELARSRGISVGTVIQAYRILEDAQLIEARARSGYYVAAKPSNLAEPEPSNPPASASAVDVSSLAADVMSLAQDPGHVSLGAAVPPAELFMEERVRRAVSRSVQRNRATLCDYPTGHGDESLRTAIARHALHFGCQLAPENIVVTNSCLESVSLCLSVVTQPGDVVAVESPTLFAFLEILENLRLRALEVPTHPRTGMSLDALEMALRTQPVKAVLTIPTLSNPLGSCIPVTDRQRMAELASAHDVPLIEDVICNDLVSQGELRRAVRSFDQAGHVMLCGSFTKTLAPGLRLGWVDGGRWGQTIVRKKAAVSGRQTAFLERALADLLRQPGIEAGFRQTRAAIAARMDEARGIIARHFPDGTRVTDPEGGFILWVELPSSIDSLELFRKCLAERIVISPGKIFGASESFGHCIRVGLGGRWDDAHREALRRVGELASTMLG